jgi:hypothetical protein
MVEEGLYKQKLNSALATGATGAIPVFDLLAQPSFLILFTE